jgi:hypothetical protein
LKNAPGPWYSARQANPETRIRFMKNIRSQGWKISLTLIILLAPWQQLNATVKQFTDANGTIHINNIVKNKAKPQNDNHNASTQHKSIEVVNPNEPTPSNIFPEPGEANALASNPNFQAPALEP